MLLAETINKQNLLECASYLKKKRFNPGFDGMSMEGASSWLQINGDRLCKDILSNNYRPMPAVSFRIAKHSGNFRCISRLTAIDTVIQNVINSQITPIAESLFLDNSFAYRPARGVTHAVERYVELANKYRYVIKFDFCSCFDNIDHRVLNESLNSFFNDKSLCELIMTLVKTPSEIDGEITSTDKGLLQGMPLSPTLCNIYLHAADCYIAKTNAPFIRYADDIVVFGNTQEEMNMLFEKISNFFKNELLLECNSKKLKIDSPSKISFLGYKFFSSKRGITSIAESAGHQTVYPFWQSRQPFNNRRKVDLISDGILRQKNYSLLFDTETRDTTIPAASTDIINIYSNVVFDSGSLSTAMKNGVTINVFDKHGDCVGSFEPNSSLKSPKVTHEQLLSYYNNKSRIRLAKEFLLASIHNTNLVIRYYNKQNANPAYDAALEKLGNLKAQIKKESSIEKMLLLEAQARNAYYSCYDLFIKREGFIFESRTRRPAKNAVNALIGFGNTVLYNYIATEIQKTPLDVRVGFLHATGNRMKSLNLDIAEIFKPLVVDRVIFTLINKGEISLSDFDQSKNGAVYLTPNGKQIFLKAFYKKLDVELNVKSINTTYRSLITEEARKLVRHFRHTEVYKAYRQVR